LNLEKKFEKMCKRDEWKTAMKRLRWYTNMKMTAENGSERQKEAEKGILVTERHLKLLKLLK
jgi:hypothetical protein